MAEGIWLMKARNKRGAKNASLRDPLCNTKDGRVGAVYADILLSISKVF